jgi:hypothetical protein
MILYLYENGRNMCVPEYQDALSLIGKYHVTTC